jgi:hypothetical protein
LLSRIAKYADTLLRERVLSASNFPSILKHKTLRLPAFALQTLSPLKKQKQLKH